MTERNTRTRDLAAVVRAYRAAKVAVIKSGFAREVEWQKKLSFDELEESSFLRESAWVVLSSGMRESVVRAKFPQVSSAFFDWQSAACIWTNRCTCRKRALESFNHQGKIDAIITICGRVQTIGFEKVKEGIRTRSMPYIQEFPYMGPATSYHLAKNIGLPVAKPDRHLTRVAKALGYATPAELCSDISAAVGDRVPVVDLVIWRYATLKSDYLKSFGLA